MAEPYTELRGEWGLVKRMQNLLDSEDGSDIVFVVGEIPDIMSFRAHRAILGASSGVFNSMFYGPLKMEDPVIDLPDINPKAFKVVLKYIYTDLIVFESMEEARLVLYAAKKYLLMPLITKCREYLIEKLGPNNVFSVYKFAESIDGEEEITRRCIHVICNQTSDLLKDVSFLNVTPSMLDVILDQDHLAITSETEILKAVILWSEAECKRREMMVNTVNKRQVIDFALRKIRILSLSPQEFVKNSDLYDILTPEEISLTLTNLVHPNIRPMPLALCANPVKRSTPLRKCPNCGAVQKSSNPLNHSESLQTFDSAQSNSQHSLSLGNSSHMSMDSFMFTTQRTPMFMIATKAASKLQCQYCGYNYL